MRKKYYYGYVVTSRCIRVFHFNSRWKNNRKLAEADRIKKVRCFPDVQYTQVHDDYQKARDEAWLMV